MTDRPPRRSELHRSRRAAALAAACGLGLPASLFLPWFHYRAEGGHQFDARGWVVFSSLDVYLAVAGAAIVAMAAAAMADWRGPAGLAIGVVCVLSAALLVPRVLSPPFEASFESVTPRAGVIAALVLSLATLALSTRVRPYRGDFFFAALRAVAAAARWVARRASAR